MRGDANADGQVNVVDVIAVQNYLTGRVSGKSGESHDLNNFANADMNNDGKIDYRDVDAIEKYIKSMP